MSDENTSIKAGANENKPLRETVQLCVNARVLKNVLTVIGSVTTEAKIVFSKDQIYSITVDPAHVQLIETVLKKELLIRYSVFTDIKDNNGTVSLGINVDNLLLKLKSVKKDDTVTLEYDTVNDPCSFTLTVGPFTHKVNTICIDGIPDHKVPRLDLPARFTISTSELKDFLTQAEKVSDHFMIKTESNKVYLTAEGDSDNVKMVPVTISNLTSNSTHKSLYSLDYFIPAIARLKNLFEYVDIYIGDDNPVRIQGYNFKDSGNGYIDIMVLIAPRIEES
jgi:DNA polymerase III sliding clamp (beta) subunit (PCNA family)